MGIFRILLLVTIVLIFCLIVLPKHPKEKTIEKKILKAIIIICLGLIIFFSATLFFFKDTLWKEQDNTALIIKRIQKDNNQLKTLKLSNYDLKNFSINTILSVLHQQPQITTFSLNEFKAENSTKLQTILTKNHTITSLIINLSEPNSIEAVIKLLKDNNNIKTFMLRKSKLSNKTIEQLTNILTYNKSIKTLGIENSNLSDNEMPQIIQLLNTQSSITNLSLLGQHFSTDSLEKLVTALQKNNGLQVLNISPGSPAEINKKLLLKAAAYRALIINFY